MPTGGAGHFWFAVVSCIAGVRVLRQLIKVEAKQADERADWHLSQMESAVRASVRWLPPLRAVIGLRADSVTGCNRGQTRHLRKERCFLAVVQRQTVEVYLFTDECLREVSNAVRQWNWRRCNLEESSRRRQPLAVAVDVLCVSAVRALRNRNSAVM